jgi:hypothetical protein
MRIAQRPLNLDIKKNEASYSIMDLALKRNVADPDSLVRSTDPAQDPDPSIIKQK